MSDKSIEQLAQDYLDARKAAAAAAASAWDTAYDAACDAAAWTAHDAYILWQVALKKEIEDD